MSESRTPLLFSPRPEHRDQWPEWYVWTDGWYEADGENTYYVDWRDLPKGATVFDIGCYEGGWIRRINQRRPDYQLYGFEPAPRAFEMAREQLSEYENINLYNFGLGVTTGRFQLYESQTDAASFLEGGKYGGQSGIEAEIVNIREFLECEGIEWVDLAAINIEGMEYELLPYLIGSRLIRQFRWLMIQWHSVVRDAFAIQQMIQNALAKTHRMVWNLGAWEAWSLRSLE
jgi:FkbM family methyltransferase